LLREFIEQSFRHQRKFRLYYLFNRVAVNHQLFGWRLHRAATQPTASPPPEESTAAGDLATSGLSSSNAPPRNTSAHDTTDLATVPVDLARPWNRIDDPTRDGWQTEAFSTAASKQLKQLADIIATAPAAGTDRLAPLLADGFTCGPLLPAELRTVYEGELLTVERPSSQDKSQQLGAEARPLASSPTHSGAAGFGRAIAALTAPFAGSETLACKFKLFRVVVDGSTMITRQYLSLSGPTSGGMLQQNATWMIRWQADTEGPPRLVSIKVVEFEQIQSRQQGKGLFADCTGSVLGECPGYHRQLLFGLNYWLERLQDQGYASLFGRPGLALGDINGDRLEDLYICQEGGLPNLLFVQQPDGTLRDASRVSAADWLEDTRAALLVDLDNDGDQDLVTAMVVAVVVSSNDGSGRFTIRTSLPTSDHTISLSAADFDHDGDLDLYVGCNSKNLALTQRGTVSVSVPSADFVYHDANDGAPNSLLRNDIAADDADWKFTDVTQEVGLDTNNRRHTLAAAWEDFDNDGDQDLYVANDYGRNNLYRNDRMPNGTCKFVDVAAAAGAEDSASGMSVSWADYDRDGWMDVYIGNMFSAAGNRITYQPQFKADASQGVRQRLRRFAQGNTLLHNRGDGSFEDVSMSAGVTLGRWAWGSNFVDINNDGWEDLFVANGYITTDDAGDL